MGVCADPGSYRWCQALSRSRSSFATDQKSINLSSNENNHNITNKQNTIKSITLKNCKETFNKIEFKQNIVIEKEQQQEKLKKNQKQKQKGKGKEKSKRNLKNEKKDKNKIKGKGKGKGKEKRYFKGKKENLKIFKDSKTIAKIIESKGTTTSATIPFSSILTTPITTRTSISNSVIERRKSRNYSAPSIIKGQIPGSELLTLSSLPTAPSSSLESSSSSSSGLATVSESASTSTSASGISSKLSSFLVKAKATAKISQLFKLPVALTPFPSSRPSSLAIRPALKPSPASTALSPNYSIAQTTIAETTEATQNPKENLSLNSTTTTTKAFRKSKAIERTTELSSFSNKSTKTATKIFNKYFDSNCCQRSIPNSTYLTNTFTTTNTNTTTTKTTTTTINTINNTNTNTNGTINTLTKSSSISSTRTQSESIRTSASSTPTTPVTSSVTSVSGVAGVQAVTGVTPSSTSSLASIQHLSKIRHLLQNHCNHLFKSLQLLLLLISVIFTTTIQANIPEDAVHITAILGEGVVFNCHVEFPNDHPVPYVLQWDKKGSDLPIYIWYESYPEHIEEGYKGRVSRVSPDSPFGSASLNLTNIKESDQGWYECKVVFLNRDPKTHKNGTWFHLDVHAPPRFSVTPEDVIYVNLGDSIILNCQADGTPTPEILWYKDANPVDPSSTVGIFNDGTELRISSIRHEDIGEYTCIARNGEGQVSHTARVIIAGGAVIMVPPSNQTKVEGEKVIFPCEAKAMPGNVTVRWFREGSPVHEVASLESRITIRKDGSLVINPVSADDSGQYLCEVTNGIGDPQSASAFLNIEFPAKVTFTPTVQYLPYGLSGVVQCYIKSNPTLQYVTWTKDKRLLEPYQIKDIVVMSNGSLLFNQVDDEHEGRYTCTPYNAKGTAGASGIMEVFVRKPPNFTVEPESLYQRKVGESVEMHCDAIEAEGTQRPTIKWQRQDGSELSDSQRNRVKVSGGNITIENLRREDFGYYQCVVSNEVATLMSITQLVIEGTQPHAPYNITGKATESSITLQWMPGYSGGSEYKQEYTIWYREAGAPDWQTISVTPSGSTQVTINSLASGTTYEFKVVGHNALGDGMMSKIMTVRTLDLLAYFDIYFHTDSNGSIVYSPPKLKLKGPKPGPPRNVSVTEVSNGFLISWQSPLERAHIVKFYTIKYRTDAQWKTLNRGQIRPEETQYLVKNLVGGRTYYFRVLANSEKSYESSDEVKFPVPARVKHKAITAGVVGGILFFIVAIILSVCAVKICSKRKRRKQEKEIIRLQSSTW